jgi:hypothetical protein
MDTTGPFTLSILEELQNASVDMSWEATEKWLKSLQVLQGKENVESST